MNEPKKNENQEPMILELDERLEFGAFLLDTGDAMADLDDTQCHCTNDKNCLGQVTPEV
jgi:hypothetical protein